MVTEKIDRNEMFKLINEAKHYTVKLDRCKFCNRIIFKKPITFTNVGTGAKEIFCKRECKIRWIFEVLKQTE